MTNLVDMMKQAQKLQARMSEMQERLADVEVTGAAGGGMVQVTLSGKVEARKVKIDPSLAGPEDVEVLEDLIVAAFNDAKAKVEAQVAEKMSELTGALTIEGYNRAVADVIAFIESSRGERPHLGAFLAAWGEASGNQFTL